MDVYIEYVIINNFAVTYLIALLSCRIITVRPKFWRLASASFIGTAAAVVYPFITGSLVLIFFKIGCGVLMSVILFNPQKLLKGTIAFFAATFGFGGAMFGLGYFVYGSVEEALTMPLSQMPFGLVVIGGLALYVMFRRTVRKFLKQRDMREFLYDAEVEINGKNIKMKAFLDSGNRLYDDKSGLPVVVAGIKAISKELDGDMLTALITCNKKVFADAHYIECGSIGGKSKMLVIKPQAVVVYEKDKKNIINDVMLGVMFGRLADAEKYGLILNPAIMIGE